MAEWGGAAESDLQAAGAEALLDGRSGVRLRGWHIESSRRPILSSLALQEWEEKLGTSHLPEMVFGESSLYLLHEDSGIKLHFNAFDALKGWKQEPLPPVEVPAADKWKFRSKPFQQVTLDYDYTFTTPYCGSETIEPNTEKAILEDGCCSLCWEDCDEQIDLAALSSKEPILFFDEVVLYEDELADNGVSLLTRVMPSYWFLLLRFWLRVDGVLMRLRDTRVYCAFVSDHKAIPVILRESCWREAPIQSLSAKGFPSDSAAYGDPNLVCQRLPVITRKTQWLKVSRSITEGS
ncbi:TIP41-like protein isoform X2 [Elaeis guineensis]|uniref:TIP41-like protein isoform X2 n=1 Tax=Elaeis guineensis var. tenera TaxID=51953 RepID=A0A8N4ETR9_ELAGV|nr:TIP41-like protein isoform X2 [Elaeis guineensis]